MLSQSILEDLAQYNEARRDPVSSSNSSLHVWDPPACADVALPGATVEEDVGSSLVGITEGHGREKQEPEGLGAAAATCTGGPDRSDEIPYNRTVRVEYLNLQINIK